MRPSTSTQRGFSELIMYSGRDARDPVEPIARMLQTTPCGKLRQLHSRNPSIYCIGYCDIAMIVIGDLSQDVSIALLHANIIPLTV